MFVLIDTNIFVDHLRGKEEAAEFLQACIDKYETVYYCVITRIELMAGMRQNELPVINELLGVFKEVSITKEIAYLAGLYMNKYMKSHGLNVPDAIIAAASSRLNSALYTLNAKHFPMNDIKVFKPY
jgi:predicted nucleic acid-binding protein